MSILISQEILASIHDQLVASTESFLLVSAYCKLPLVRYFDSCITNSNLKKKLVVRFRPDDIASGSSDLEIYPYCKNNGWQLFFRLDLHAKTYVFDRLRCIVGSANATSKGLSLGGTGNYEIATACTLSESDRSALKRLLLGAVEMNDFIYQTMQSSLASHTNSDPHTDAWPTEITSLFVPNYSVLFAEDFPQCEHPAEATTDDLLFLNLFLSVADPTNIAQALRHTKCYLWLVNLLEKQNNHEMYFGAITANLHEVLLNDPKPFRKDVKRLLSNLLTWITDLKMAEFYIDVPHHSQRVRYRKA